MDPNQTAQAVVGSEQDRSPELAPTAKKINPWQESEYAERHRLTRVNSEALGIELPKRVRLYRRRNHFICQWWDVAQRRTLNERVNGDLIAAIARARAIEERVVAYKTAGGPRRQSIDELIEAYSVDLNRRADAGEISPASARRYHSALRHLRAFLAPSVEKQYRYASLVDRAFRLSFAAHLQQESGSAARCGSKARVQHTFVLDTCRALFAWAADPQRGNHLGDSFRNPFSEQVRNSTAVHSIRLGEPDITVEMAGDFLRHCDAYQLRLFGVLLLCGLRPSEITYLFHESNDQGWLRVRCLPELAYFTKGRRDKQFPFVDTFRSLIEPRKGGLIFVRRGIPETCLQLDDVRRALERRWSQLPERTADNRQRVRDQVLLEIGCLNYDRIEGEFHAVASHLDWPKSATLKDFRHLFSTCLENAGMPEFYRRFLMGQSPGRTAIVSYTHLNRLKEQFEEALNAELAPVVAAIGARRNILEAALPVAPTA